jgi:UDP-N-acetyl-2-amino-2-deoxyglucuronate dehydrogenase
MPANIGFGLVGCGVVGEVHAEALRAVPGGQLVAVCARDPARTAQFAARFGATAYNDYERFLEHRDLHVVSVCTPNGTHAELGCRAAAAGKHVLVEKPMDISLTRADALIDACAAAQVKLAVILPSRLLPAVQHIKRAVDEGRLGRLLLSDAYVKWYRMPAYYAPGSWHGTLTLDGGGALINQAIHTVDLLRWITGPATLVFAMMAAQRYPRLEAEDTLVGSVRFQNGALGVIEAATSAKPGFKRRLEITGERGTVVLKGDTISCWAIEGENTPAASGPPGPDAAADPTAIAVAGHRGQMADLVQAIMTDREPVINGHEGRTSLELVLALYRSAVSGQSVSL